ncbi:MAG: helix-turn-helix domain-containing protein [Pseudomonadota bacterium]
MTDAATVGPRQRRPQERAEKTKKKLLDTAILEFSERGFDAVTVRDIEIRADVQRNLLKYHFGSKEGIWEASASELIERLNSFMSPREQLVRDLSPHERVAYTIRSYVRFSAANPAFNRMMIQEGKHDSWRMHWLVDNFLRSESNALREQLQADIGLTDDEFIHWHYIFAGGGALMFSMAPEARRLFNIDVSDDEIIDRHAHMMVDLLLSRSSD